MKYQRTKMTAPRYHPYIRNQYIPIVKTNTIEINEMYYNCDSHNHHAIETPEPAEYAPTRETHQDLGIQGDDFSWRDFLSREVLSSEGENDCDSPVTVHHEFEEELCEMTFSSDLCDLYCNECDE